MLTEVAMRGAAFCLTMAIVLAAGWPIGQLASAQTKDQGSPVGKMPAPPTGKEITQQGDAGFVQRLAVNDLFDMASSRWLLERSKNPAVRTFAGRVLKEHEGSLRKLTAVAKTKKIAVTIPTSLDEKHYQMLQRLRNLPYEKMDQGYVQEQIDTHQESLALLHDCSANCRNPRLMEFAKDQEKMEQGHLAAARELAQRVANPQ